MTLKEAQEKARQMQTPGRTGGIVSQVVIVKYSDNDYEAIPAAYLTDASYTGSRTVVETFNA